MDAIAGLIGTTGTAAATGVAAIVLAVELVRRATGLRGRALFRVALLAGQAVAWGAWVMSRSGLAAELVTTAAIGIGLTLAASSGRDWLTQSGQRKGGDATDEASAELSAVTRRVLDDMHTTPRRAR